MPEPHPFIRAYRGAFSGILRWPQLDELWETLRQQTDKQWYIYAVGETPPSQVSDAAQLDTFLQAIDQLLRSEIPRIPMSLVIRLNWGHLSTESIDSS